MITPTADTGGNSAALGAGAGYGVLNGLPGQTWQTIDQYRNSMLAQTGPQSALVSPATQSPPNDAQNQPVGVVAPSSTGPTNSPTAPQNDSSGLSDRTQTDAGRKSDPSSLTKDEAGAVASQADNATLAAAEANAAAAAAGNIQAPVKPPPTGALAYGAKFSQGVAQGFFVDGLWGDTKGLWDTIKGIGSGISYGARIFSDYWFGTKSFTDEEAVELDRRLTAVETFGREMTDHGVEIVQAVLDGDSATLGRYSAFAQQVGSVAAAALGELKDVLIEEVKDPQTQGRIVGWILSQVAEAVITLGIANAAKAGKLSNLASKLDNIPFIGGNPKVKAAVEEALVKAEHALVVLNNGGCFSPDTLVLMAEQSAPEHCSGSAVLTTCPIASVALGARVVGENPKSWEVDQELAEPDASWVRIAAQARRADGATVEMEFLRPRHWAEAYLIYPGRRLSIRYEELRLDGVVTITAVSPAPPIAPGDGQVVTGRFITREIGNLVRLQFSDGAQLDVTDTHPVWSRDRQDWAPAGELRSRERLDGAYGPVEIDRVSILGRAPAVYNLEVHAQHVFRVAAPGVLVHNTTPGCHGAPQAPSNLARIATKVEIDPNKFKYLFGEVTSGTHNTARSLQLVRDLNRIGISNTAQGRQILTQALEKAAKDPSNITKTFTKTIDGAVQTFETRESLLAGPGGFIKIESTWEVLADGVRRFSRMIPFGG